MLLKNSRRLDPTWRRRSGLGEIGTRRGLRHAGLLQGDTIGVNAIGGGLGDLRARRVEEGQYETDSGHRGDEDDQILSAIAPDAGRCQRRLPGAERYNRSRG